VSVPKGYSLKDLIEQLRNKVDLRMDQAREASRQLADPAVSDLEKGDFLVALRVKGESGQELGYFARSFLELAIRPALQLEGKPSVDIVGTGGDRLELINVSTTCMFLLAAAGVVVLKHGNKAITSKAGAADVLENLGIPIACSPEKMSDCIHRTGVGFFFAPLYHPAFRLVAPIRRKLAEQGIATVFNLLGPLLNPAEPTCQLTGVFSPTILERYAIALREVGRSRAWVVHGQIIGGSGMDEVPDQLGFRKPSLHELRGGDAADNARALIDILANRDRSARRDLITINAAAGLVIAGVTSRMESGIQLANELLDSGLALEKLREFQRFFTS
jgi:anthranilate phosphoribosyltransferase